LAARVLILPPKSKASEGRHGDNSRSHQTDNQVSPLLRPAATKNIVGGAAGSAF
jgi:hypothetical protein